MHHALAFTLPLLLFPAAPPGGDLRGLESQLLAEEAGELARAAGASGDPVRGAVLFHQTYVGCARCHDGGRLGPDLARIGLDVSLEDLVEGTLRPSTKIRDGFEAVVVITQDGRSFTGLVARDDAETLAIRDAAADGKEIVLAKDGIARRERSDQSIMPSGLVAQLGSRQDFLDLVAYLGEIARGGPSRALELRPPPELLVAPPLPEYEERLDHAGMIRDLDEASLRRGRRVYERLCANCHGTHDAPGSLPTALRFASGTFKNGSDPFSMYRTLTRGYGMMVPQVWMVPREKYDVIHSIREDYLKRHNPSQYVTVDAAYLATLPAGDTRGPEPVASEPWVTMDYGPSLINTYEIGDGGRNIAQKGIAVRLDPGPGGISRGRFWMVFDHDTLRAAAAWSGDGFIDWNGIHFNGRHQVHPRAVGRVHFENPTGPGWARPGTRSFDDQRLRGRDGRPYGPLPRDWARYEGLYHHGQRGVIAYMVGATRVLEMPGLTESGSLAVFTRTFAIGPRSEAMVLQVLRHPDPGARVSPISGRRDAVLAATSAPGRPLLAAGASPPLAGAEWLPSDGGNVRLEIPAGDAPLSFTLWVTRAESAAEAGAVRFDPPAIDLRELTRGGPARWPHVLETKAAIGSDSGPFALDVLTHPERNPWLARLRFGGFDFLPGGESAVVATWDGDVWLAGGIDRPERGLSWRRIASGLFQPLGLKVIDGKIHVACRDQIAVLHDLNGDGETDFYECFNNDHQVTEHFHEFAMGLEVDAAGNLYYAKGARHALEALVPHHGTLLRVRPDGSRTEIVATGFRAPNGVCVNADGTFFVSDQEGHWTPKNRINLVQEGGFYGNMWGYHDVTDPSDAAMKPPLAWITNSFDRSPAELLWVPERAWGPLGGSLLSLSYGYGKVHVVLRDETGGRLQGGLVALPIPPFPTGIHRGRFHPGSGQLYTCGLFAWAGNQQQPGGFYRVRYTGRPLHVPVELHALDGGLEVRFTCELDEEAATDPGHYAVRTWALERSAHYGSKHRDEQRLHVARVRVSEDQRTVFLEIPDLRPTWCLEIRYDLKAGNERVEGTIHGTVHALGKRRERS